MVVTAVPAVAHRSVVTGVSLLVKGFRLSVLNCGFLPLFCWGSSVCRTLAIAEGEVLDLLSYYMSPVMLCCSTEKQLHRLYELHL